MNFAAPVCASQTLTVNSPPSAPAEAIRWPSGARPRRRRRPVAGNSATWSRRSARPRPEAGVSEAGRDDLPAVGADRQAPDLVRRVAEGQALLPALVAPERGRVPDADGPVLAGRGEAPAVRAERHAPAKPRCARGGRAPPGRSPRPRRARSCPRPTEARRRPSGLKATPRTSPPPGLRDGQEVLAGRRVPTRPRGGRNWPWPATRRPG